MSQSDYRALAQRLRRLSAQALDARQIGIEKEGLRVATDGRLAQTPHPASLGSALTHPYITTDFSEALLELVTPPVQESWAALQCLVDLHQFVYEQIGDEMVWATSMPCAVSRDQEVPLARYGSSNVGMMKHVYRRGLGHRYGRLMQTIAGVHFNFSVGATLWQELLGPRHTASDVSVWYFGLLRNFRRFGWLTLYLFGASPAACRSFLGDNDGGLEEYESTLFGTHATSLRMSDVGYKNKVQSRLEIPVNDIANYVDGLTRATNTPYEPYKRIGVVVDGEYRQLNANILQIENEYYSLVRPKRVARSGEKPTYALRRGGVEYVEVRAVDVNPFDPAGIGQAQIRFLEIMLVFCLLHDSPPISADEQACIDHNQLAAARHGRNPALQLRTADGAKSLREWASELCEQMQPVAALFDGQGTAHYAQALAQQQAAIADAELTPSARVLREMRDAEESFFEFALRMSVDHRDYFAMLAGIHEGRRRQLETMARDSLAEQARIEASDSVDFTQFLQGYFAQPP